MDRISALRNVEEALGRYEEDELSLPELEREVRGTLRTYATAFDDGTLYRVRGESAADGLVVVANSRVDAREQVDELLSGSVTFELERVEP